MKLLAAVLLATGLLATAARGDQHLWQDEPSRTCFFQTLEGTDKDFCRGDLEVIYPEVGDVSCIYVPKCHQYRRRISREWGSPRVRYPQAEKGKKYVLVLVDPDAPSRANPRNRFWRHWLVTDIPDCLLVHTPVVPHPVPTALSSPLFQGKKYVLVLVDPDAPSRANPRNRFWRHWLVTDIPGADLRTGDIKGRVLTDYVRPTPPPRSGYHRYQLLLYQQPAHTTITLRPEEWVSLGSWAMESFLKQFRLGSPVASTQFLTKYYED
ncbi:PREDICTED: phosphatidylethanolamine-binding protein 4 [Calidris pugnax]|uniref:phosphatidylethanolamine-binding protein 4 n=1 Tax=Calidris pugnax TaxID=198806 RepID=UPI00071D6051|nr:PREDICTED: phosphatidylethanolamine-binding protein 4 [Calidris pugnax]